MGWGWGLSGGAGTWEALTGSAMTDVLGPLWLLCEDWVGAEVAPGPLTGPPGGRLGVGVGMEGKDTGEPSSLVTRQV